VVARLPFDTALTDTVSPSADRNHVARMIPCSRWHSLVAIALALFVTGCSAMTDIECTDEARGSFAVVVRDSLTAAPISAGSTLSWTGASTGASSIAAGDTARNGGALSGPFEVPGRFQLRVTHAGYRDWTTTIQVPHDRCHVHGVSVTALMQRVAP
jgi:hypothetical protein